MVTDYSKILQVGEAHATTAEQLAKEMGFSDTRELRRDIARARAAGQVICTSSRPDGGYFLPETKAEVVKWVNTTSRKAASTFAALKSARAVLKEMDGQIKIEENS